MKNRLNTLFSDKIIYILMLCLGFNVSCGSSCEYGSPFADYSIKGKVTNSDQEGIAGIKIEVQGLYTKNIITTQTDGSYALNARNSGIHQLTIAAQDIDGIENGEYQDKTEIIPIFQDDYKGGSGWNQGKVTKTVDITLVKK